MSTLQTLTEGSQRAYRERKAKQVKDLETKAASLAAAHQQVILETEHLLRDIEEISAENESLRTILAIRSGSGLQASPSGQSATTDWATYNWMRFIPMDLHDNVNIDLLHPIVGACDAERLLTADETLNYIMSHELCKRGQVKMGSVSEQIKASARYDGIWPMFPEKEILNAIEQSVADGSDDLL